MCVLTELHHDISVDCKPQLLLTPSRTRKLVAPGQSASNNEHVRKLHMRRSCASCIKHVLSRERPLCRIKHLKQRRLRQQTAAATL